jgi:hypothetical protein
VEESFCLNNLAATPAYVPNISHPKTVTWEENRNISLKWSYWLASAPAVLEVELKVQLTAGSVGMKQSILP